MFDFNPPKPGKIRTRTVTVAVKQPPAPSSRKAEPSNRFTLTSAPSSERKRKEFSVSRVKQRTSKAAVNTLPQFADSDESDEEEELEVEDRLSVRKRQKMSSSMEPPGLNRCLEPDHKRRLRIYEGDERLPTATPANDQKFEPARLVPGLEMSQGKFEKDYQTAFPLVVELQYPSPLRPEKFETVTPFETDNYNPLNDIYLTIDEIIRNYLPDAIREKFSDEADGIVRRLKRAVTKNSPSDFQATLTEFNTAVKANMAEISQVLDDTHAIRYSLAKRIMDQVYERTVSYRAHLLKRVKGKETTYGELLTQFAHTIFQKTGLNSESVFVDLGSGVGNVVLQAALQTGAESWGIEIMNQPARYALDQASELRARSKLWNISLGSITLLHGDFLNSPEIDAVLRRADVVLVNNKVFPQKLNGELLDKFLDLKDGCKVVSLESFGGGGAAKQGGRNENSIANLFDIQRFESGTSSVSWADESVEYFIATKAR